MKTRVHLDSMRHEVLSDVVPGELGVSVAGVFVPRQVILLTPVDQILLASGEKRTADIASVTRNHFGSAVQS
jgi:hypothetical protein